MAAKKANVIPEEYVIARFAEWAGDFDYALTLFESVSRGKNIQDNRKSGMLPSEIFSLAASRKYRQIWRRQTKREDKKDLLLGRPEIIVTPHMRAVLWMFEEDEIEMRAFLTDLSWESKLFTNAQELAGIKSVLSVNSEEKEEIPVLAGMGVRWSLQGKAITHVTLDDLGLLQSRTVWAKSPSFDEVISFHSQLLVSIEGEGAGVALET
jgi:hypothetical protein